MPTDAGIVRLLASFYRETSPKVLEMESTFWAGLPPSFLVLCWNNSLRCLQAQDCAKCRQGKVHERKAGHSRQDCLPLYLQDQCRYHEHGEDADERKACTKRWEERLKSMLARSGQSLEQRRLINKPVVKIEPADTDDLMGDSDSD